MDVIVLPLASFVTVSLGAILLLTVRAIHDSWRNPDPKELRLVVMILGWFQFVIALGILVAIQLLAHDEIAKGGDPAPTVVLALLASTVPLLLGGMGLLTVRVGGTLRPGFSLFDDPRRDRWLWAITVGGWGLVVVGALLLYFVVGLVLLAAIVLVVLNTMGNQYRVRQGSLLWLLAIAVDKGLPLPDEIEAYAKNLRGRPRRRAATLANLLRDGTSLPHALDSLPGLVPSSAALAAHVGAQSGTLPQALRDAAVHFTAQQRERATRTSSLGGFLFYMGTLLMVAPLIVGFLMYWIIPKFKKIFAGFGVEMPQVTIALIQVSDAVADYFYLFVPFLLVPIGILALSSGAYYWGGDSLMLRSIQGWLFRIDTPSILRNLARVISANQPLVAGVKEMAAFHRHPRVRVRLLAVVGEIERGNDCWGALLAARFIRNREWALLKSAERVGNLPWALRLIADGIERRQTYRLLAWAEILQPAVVLIGGCCVFFIFVAMFMPLVKLINDLS